MQITLGGSGSHARKMFASAAIGVLALVSLLAVGPTADVLSAPSAASATAGTYIGGAGVAELSVAVATKLPATDTDTVWLAAAGDSNALAQANANSAQAGGAAVAAESTDAGVLAQISEVGPTKVILVGAPGQFPQSLTASLANDYTLETKYVSDQPLGWSTGHHDASRRANVVVGDLDVPDSVALAASAAISRRATLVLLDGSEPTDSVAQILGDPSNEFITVVGDSSAMTVYEVLPEEVTHRIVDVPITDSAAAELTLLYDQIGNGSRALSVVASTTRSAGELATAARYATSVGAVAATTGVAKSYLEDLKTPAIDVVLIGVGADSASANALAATQRPANALPAIRVTDTTRNESAATSAVAFTPVSQATKYVAYDLAGSTVGTSTNSPITVTGEPSSTAIIAYNSAGTTLKTIQYRVNDYATAASRADAIIASTVGAENHLVFLGPTNLPRLVTRTKTSITEQIPDARANTETVAVICGTTFTDTSLAKTFQYDYRVTTLSRDPATCNAIGAPGDPTEIDLGGLTFPATEFPAAASKSPPGSLMSSREKPANSASASVMEQARLKPIGSSAALAPGDGWETIRFRYQTFIIPSKIAGAGFGKLTRPFVAFGGDGRNFYHPNGSYRTRQDAYMSFGSSHRITHTPAMGETKKYACRWPNLSDCEQIGSKFAPMNELSLTGVSSNNTGGRFTFKVDATNPLQSGAPAISANVTVYGRPGGTTITGKHDRMPIHEVWFTVEGWGEWYWVYGSEYHRPICLIGSIPTCTAKVNVRL